MQCANENLRSDLDRWHLEKKKDIRSLLLGMAYQQIQFYEDVSFVLTFEEWLLFICGILIRTCICLGLIILGTSYSRSEVQ